MPEMFPDVLTFVLCALIVAGAQLIYATVGFGGGMFSVALLAMVLVDLAPAVATLLILTFVTEVVVLFRAWRHARFRLLLGVLPAMAVGMWFGTEWLAGGNVAWLKRGLGAVIFSAGAWFLIDERRIENNRHSGEACADDVGAAVPPMHVSRKFAGWLSVPVGLTSGVLAGLFGTGGPPVIVYLRGYGLDKGPFRATLLWYFMIMSFARATTYLKAGLLTQQELLAAAWLLPGSIVGVIGGMLIHHRLSQRRFATAVSAILMALGLLLALGVGR